MMETTTACSSSSSSSCSSARLPEDIQEEILKRLPVRILARFSCVCKSWGRLFTNPSFASTHLRLHSSTAPTRILLSRYFKTPLSISIPSNSSIHARELHLSLLDGNTYYVKGHCHGLLCLILSDGTILLWNPTTHHCKTLPSPPNFKKTREVLGIGFDPSLNDYKIIRFPSAYCKSKVRDYHPQVEVFTLGSNSWRKLPDEDTPPFFVEHYQQSVSLNGAVYWLGLCNRSTVILRFDLAGEKFSVVPPPPPPNNASMNLSWVGVLKDSLCVIHAGRGHHFDVWAMRDDRNWEKMVTVLDIDPDLEPSLSTVDYVPVCFVESGELIMSVKGNGLVAYDPERGRYRQVAAMEDHARWLQETAYTDTLISPHGYGSGGGDYDDGQLLHKQRGSSIGFARNLWEMLEGHWWRGSATK